MDPQATWQQVLDAYSCFDFEAATEAADGGVEARDAHPQAGMRVGDGEPAGRLAHDGGVDAVRPGPAGSAASPRPDREGSSEGVLNVTGPRSS